MRNLGRHEAFARLGWVKRTSITRVRWPCQTRTGTRDRLRKSRSEHYCSVLGKVPVRARDVANSIPATFNRLQGECEPAHAKCGLFFWESGQASGPSRRTRQE